ncbi:hypothetical protein Tco_0702430 [Tanacetum coccineum]|uniref:Uncharacterized protein n=1 Tax=Tanacetum coccineum TaxID=301880 RepID=A0ABQ4XVY3_9ASTR
MKEKGFGVLENIKGDNNYLNEFLEADRQAKHFNQQAQSQFVRDRDIIRDLEKQRDKLDLAVTDYKRKNKELHNTSLILKKKNYENEDRYHDTILDLEAKLKKNVDLILKLGNASTMNFMLGPKAFFLSKSEIPLNVRDTEDTLDDASKSQQKMKEKMNDPIAVANKQNLTLGELGEIVRVICEEFVDLKLAIRQDLGFIPSGNVVLSSTYVGKILGADQLLVILCYRYQESGIGYWILSMTINGAGQVVSEPVSGDESLTVASYDDRPPSRLEECGNMFDTLLTAKLHLDRYSVLTDHPIRRIHQLDTTYPTFLSGQHIEFYCLNGVSVSRQYGVSVSRQYGVFIKLYTAYCYSTDSYDGLKEIAMDEMCCNTSSLIINTREPQIGDEFLKILRDNAFNGMDGGDVIGHIVRIIEITEWIKISDINKNQLRIHVFSKSLCNDAKKWWNDEVEGTTISWDELKENL